MIRIYTPDVNGEEVFDSEITGVIPYYRMYGAQYCLPSFVQYTSCEAEKLRSASQAVHRIYTKVLRFAQMYLPDSYLIGQLGLEPAMIPAARIALPFTGIERQDWIMSEQGMRCIENNTETPSGIPEAAFLERVLLSRYMKNPQHTPGPSAGMDALLSRVFVEAVDFFEKEGLGRAVTFTCPEGIIEDLHNTQYLLQRCEEAGLQAKFVPLEELRIIPEQGLYHNGEQISILYRLYPLEFLVHDKDETSGVLVGQELLRLAEQGKIGLINPPQNIISQSKGFMATIWSLYERNELTRDYLGFTLFDEEDVQAIEDYLLPTYFTPEPFLRSGIPFAAKGYWGREGKGTVLHDKEYSADESPCLPDGTVSAQAAENEDESSYYDSQPKIFQKLHPMMQVTVPTEKGDYAGYLLTGVYVLNGRYAGVLSRIGAKVTGDMAYYCPAVVKD
ncbi:glutathionylspermidine synthase family protein [Paenibacillus tuaregi]|uniref:glutathionylspermidine synthase family protein n=1 Tax=Paenibacillus tuaregi TaxID=1816681 RepID=UPI000837F155|nr:glutathionylspermidine synthase family protein [Paenibacillus tuaregi]